MADEPKKPSSSGEHALKLEKLHSSKPPIDGGIDVDKLNQAWSAMVGVQLELIRVIEKAEEDNARTRADNAKTRRLVAGMTILAVALLGLSMAVILNRQAAQLRAEREAAELRATTHENVAATLRVVRVLTRALGAKIEADAALTPSAETKALKLGVEAQRAAIEAEQAVSRDPATKQQAERELKTIEKKERAIDAAAVP